SRLPNLALGCDKPSPTFSGRVLSISYTPGEFVPELRLWSAGIDPRFAFCPSKPKAGINARTPKLSPGRPQSLTGSCGSRPENECKASEAEDTLQRKAWLTGKPCRLAAHACCPPVSDGRDGAIAPVGKAGTFVRIRKRRPGVSAGTTFAA